MQKKKTVKKAPAKKATVKKVEKVTVEQRPSPEPTTNDVLLSMMQFLSKMNDTQNKILERLSPVEESKEPEIMPEEETQHNVIFEVYWEFNRTRDSQFMMTIETFWRYTTRARAEQELEKVKNQWTWQPYYKNGFVLNFKRFDIKEIVQRTFTRNPS